MKHVWISLVLALCVACQPVTPAPVVISTGTPFSTSMPLALSTAVPVATPFFDTTIQYELRHPTAEELLGLIDSVLLLEENNIPNGPSLITNDPSSLQPLIGSDFGRFYLDGFPNVEDLLAQTTLPWEMKSFADLSSFNVVLRIALLQYINHHQDYLENHESFPLENITIKTYALDFDGDGELEWLIGAEYESYSLLSWLLIKKQSDGRYRLLLNDPAYDLVGVGDRSVDILMRDLTGDGSPEIIHALHYYLAGTMHTIITVYTWNEGLSAFDSIYLPNVPPRYGEMYESEYEVGDFNNDGVDDIRVITPRFGRFDCEWIETNYYRFDNQEMKNEKVGSEIPETNECLISRALLSNLPSKQIELYQKAIENFDPKVTSVDKVAWTRVQLAMAYAAKGDDTGAVLQLEMLNSMEGGGKFLQFVRNIYRINHDSPLAFCDALYIATYRRFWDRIGSDIDSELTHDLYPIDFAPIPTLVCPFTKTVKARLEGIQIPIGKPPIEVFTRHGIPFAWSKSINWDDDPLQEWVGVLQFSKPTIVLLDGDTFWQSLVIESNSVNSSSLDAATYFPSDQTSPDLFVLFTTDGRYCDLPDTEKHLIKIDPKTYEYDVQVKCDSVIYSLVSRENIEFAITEFSKANRLDSENNPEWYYLTDRDDVDGYQNDIMDFARAVEDLIISQDDPVKADLKLNSIISALPPDDLSAKLLLSRLYYLRGLNYELSGQEELAVHAYLGLIEFSPDSIWSRYAEFRLQPAQ